MEYTDRLSQTEMIDKLIENGITACPHFYWKEWIYVPLHNRDNAIPIADFYGWEWINLGFKPKEFKKVIKIDVKIKGFSLKSKEPEQPEVESADNQVVSETVDPNVRCVNCED